MSKETLGEVCGYGCLKKNGCGRERASGPSSGRMNQPVGCTPFTRTEIDTFTIISAKGFAEGSSIVRSREKKYLSQKSLKPFLTNCFAICILNSAWCNKQNIIVSFSHFSLIDIGAFSKFLPQYRHFIFIMNAKKRNSLTIFLIFSSNFDLRNPSIHCFFKVFSGKHFSMFYRC